VQQALKKEDGEQDRIAYIEGQIYIPNNQKLKKQILQENHDSADVGHLEQQRMMELVKRNYWWPGLKEDVKKYICSRMLRRNWENYIYSIYYKVHGKKLVLMLLDHYPSQIE